MEITASGRNDLGAVTALTRANMFGRAEPKRMLIFLLAVIGAAALIETAVIVVFKQGSDRFEGLLTLACCAVTAGLLLWMFTALPKKKYEQLGAKRDMLNRYRFTEEGFSVAVDQDGFSAGGAHSYASVLKVAETGEFFFMYLSGGVLIVNRASVEGGTPEELRELLKSRIAGKYVVCKY